MTQQSLQSLTTIDIYEAMVQYHYCERGCVVGKGTAQDTLMEGGT
jgi:hypothetical protein